VPGHDRVCRRKTKNGGKGNKLQQMAKPAAAYVQEFRGRSAALASSDAFQVRLYAHLLHTASDVFANKAFARAFMHPTFVAHG